MAEQYVPYRPGYTYGMGVNDATGSRMQIGIKTEGQDRDVAGATGGTSFLQITKVQSTSDMEDALAISAEVSGGVGLFSASGRFDFAKSAKVQNTSITLLVSHSLFCGFRQINEPTLSSVASDLVANPVAFNARYGEHFVVGLQSGGVFFGFIRVDTSSEQSRQTIDASMSGSYGLAFSAEASMKLSQAMAQTSSSCETKIYYEGGKVIQNANPLQPVDVLNAHKEWLESCFNPDGTPSILVKPYAALLLPYTIADGPLPPNPEQLQHQRDVLMHCAKLRSACIDKQNLVEYILNHSDQFPAGPADLGLDAISRLASQLAADLEQISSAASYAINHADKAKSPETFDAVSPDSERAANNLYAFATLPPNIPKHSGAANVTIPDFRQSRTPNEARQLAAHLRLTLHWTLVDPAGAWKIMSQDPPAGMIVNPNTTVTLVQPKVDFGHVDHP